MCLKPQVLHFTCYCLQAVLSSRPEGDSKLQDLKRRAQSLCEHQDLEESRRREVQQTIREVEEEWRRILQEAEKAQSQAEVQEALEKEVKGFKAYEESTRLWVRNLQHRLVSLGSLKNTEDKLKTAQVRLGLGSRMISAMSECEQ